MIKSYATRRIAAIGAFVAKWCFVRGAAIGHLYRREFTDRKYQMSGLSSNLRRPIGSQSSLRAVVIHFND